MFQGVQCQSLALFSRVADWPWPHNFAQPWFVGHALLKIIPYHITTSHHHLMCVYRGDVLLVLQSLSSSSSSKRFFLLFHHCMYSEILCSMAAVADQFDDNDDKSQTITSRRNSHFSLVYYTHTSGVSDLRWPRNIHVYIYSL